MKNLVSLIQLENILIINIKPCVYVVFMRVQKFRCSESIEFVDVVSLRNVLIRDNKRIEQIQGDIKDEEGENHTEGDSDDQFINEFHVFICRNNYRYKD